MIEKRSLKRKKQQESSDYSSEASPEDDDLDEDSLEVARERKRRRRKVGKAATLSLTKFYQRKKMDSMARTFCLPQTKRKNLVDLLEENLEYDITLELLKLSFCSF